MSTDTLELIEFDVDLNANVQCTWCEEEATWRTSHPKASHLICSNCKKIVSRNIVLAIASIMYLHCSNCNQDNILPEQIRFNPLN